jgi:hypothetical protein
MASCNCDAPVIFKLDRATGTCDVVKIKEILNSSASQPRKESHKTGKGKSTPGFGPILQGLAYREKSSPGRGVRMFVQACVLAGCDYAPSLLNGIGLVNSFKLVRDNANRPPEAVFKSLLSSLPKKAKKNLSMSIDQYEEILAKSEAVFYYHPVKGEDEKVALLQNPTSSQDDDDTFKKYFPSLDRFDGDLSFLGDLDDSSTDRDQNLYSSAIKVNRENNPLVSNRHVPEAPAGRKWPLVSSKTSSGGYNAEEQVNKACRKLAQICNPYQKRKQSAKTEQQSRPNLFAHLAHRSEKENAANVASNFFIRRDPRAVKRIFPKVGAASKPPHASDSPRKPLAPGSVNNASNSNRLSSLSSPGKENANNAPGRNNLNVAIRTSIDVEESERPMIAQFDYDSSTSPEAPSRKDAASKDKLEDDDSDSESVLNPLAPSPGLINAVQAGQRRALSESRKLSRSGTSKSNAGTRRQSSLQAPGLAARIHSSHFETEELDEELDEASVATREGRRRQRESNRSISFDSDESLDGQEIRKSPKQLQAYVATGSSKYFRGKRRRVTLDSPILTRKHEQGSYNDKAIDPFADSLDDNSLARMDSPTTARPNSFDYGPRFQRSNTTRNHRGNASGISSWGSPGEEIDSAEAPLQPVSRITSFKPPRKYQNPSKSRKDTRTAKSGALAMAFKRQEETLSQESFAGSTQTIPRRKLPLNIPSLKPPGSKQRSMYGFLHIKIDDKDDDF